MSQSLRNVCVTDVHVYVPFFVIKFRYACVHVVSPFCNMSITTDIISRAKAATISRVHGFKRTFRRVLAAELLFYYELFK